MPCSFCGMWIECTADRPISNYTVQTGFKENELMKLGGETWILYEWAQIKMYWYELRGPENKVFIMVCDDCETRAIQDIQRVYNEYEPLGDWLIWW